MKILPLPVLLTFVFTSLSGHSATPQNYNEGVAGCVNKQIITFSELRSVSDNEESKLRERYSGTELQNQIRASRVHALNDLIDQELLVQEFHHKEFSLPDNSVDEEYGRELQTLCGGDEKVLLTKYGMTPEELRSQVERQMIIQSMRQRLIVQPARQQLIQQGYTEQKLDQETVGQELVRQQSAKIGETVMKELRSRAFIKTF